MIDSQKAVFITGASGGIGKCLCKLFSKEGFYVIATDKIQREGDYNYFIELDLINFVSKEPVRKKFRQDIKCLLEDKSLLGLINNAAIQITDKMEDIKPKDFQESFDVNVKAPLVFTQDLLSYLKQSKGSVVNIGSIHSDLTKKYFMSYAVSKAALKGLTKSMSIDLATYGINTNLIQPGATRTKMLEAGFNKNKEALSKLESFHPLGRIGLPEEIAKIALFLVENRDSFINGASIQVDGGISRRLHDPD